MRDGVNWSRLVARLGGGEGNKRGERRGDEGPEPEGIDLYEIDLGIFQ